MRTIKLSCVQYNRIIHKMSIIVRTIGDSMTDNDENDDLGSLERKKNINIRLTPLEHKRAKAYAKKHGIKLSALIRAWLANLTAPGDEKPLGDDILKLVREQNKRPYRLKRNRKPPPATDDDSDDD